MKFRRTLAKIAVAAALILSPRFASLADILISNLAEPLRDASPIGNTGVLPPPAAGDWSWAAQSFLTDGNPYVLDSIEAIVGDGTTEPFPAVVAELHGDDSGLVGTLIATFTAPDLSGALTARPFLPDSSVTLSANEKYWFVLGAVNPSDGTYYWGYAEGNGSLGSGALSNFNYSYDSGTTWSDFGSDNPFFLQVNVSPLTIVDADFNDDGSLDCLDIDALVAEIATNTQNPCRGRRRLS
jgi:hypothetical protein